MENFTPIASLAGGILIGLSATVMLLLHGRVTGITGITAGLIDKRARGDILWRALFIGGLVATGLVVGLWAPQAFRVEIDRSVWAILAAGLLVGFGTRLGSGCTSGHGVCGLSRLAPRSLVATGSFMAAGAATVFVIQTVFAGAL